MKLSCRLGYLFTVGLMDPRALCTKPGANTSFVCNQLPWTKKRFRSLGVKSKRTEPSCPLNRLFATLNCSLMIDTVLFRIGAPERAKVPERRAMGEAQPTMSAPVTPIILPILLAAAVA